MIYKIEPRDGAEVYVGAKGHIIIKQLQGGVDEQIIILHPEEVEELITGLKIAYNDSLDFVPEPDEAD